jgi:arsenite-transporting ATPase
MGKGGVGKTTIASNIALELSKKGHKVVLSTTDPASHLNYLAKSNDNLSIERIDPKLETQKFVISMEVNSKKNLTNLKEAIENFNFSNIEKIWNGEVDV